MQLFSSSPNSIFPPSLNPNSSKTHFRIQTKILQTTPPLLKIPPFSSSKDSSAPALEEKLSNNEFRSEEVVETEGMLMVRRPVKEFIREADGGSLSGSDGREDMEGNKNSKSVIDESLSELAKKMPIFEPKRVETSPKEKPIPINLELGLYRAKVLTKNFQYNEAIDMLGKCVLYWPEDGRAYVALGKIFSKQSRYVEARAVYERGCQATQGENSYIWQCWAVLENKMGNLQRARELFDAATVANNKHIAAWHGWAILELKQGNIKKGRNLLAKGIKYSGGNEYIYQTLALLEAKGKRIEEARYLFKQATNCNPKSCASWLAWAQVEMQQENNFAARKLFEQAVQASPKNRFAWHVWGIFEANLGDINKGRKLLKIGHALNPRDPVLLQSLALLEYKYSTANLARVLFRRASELDPKHQPVWVAWGWMEWREGNLDAARQLYRTALSINPRSESAARCLQAWGVLEQRIGDYTTARRFFRASLDVNSQSFVTWMTWALMEEEIGDSIRAEEIRELYFLQHTEVVDDSSWGMGFQDMIDPALNSIKKFLNIEQESYFKGWDALRDKTWTTYNNELEKVKTSDSSSDFDVDAFVKETLNLDTSKLDILMETPQIFETKVAYKSVWRAKKRTPAAKAQSLTDSTKAPVK